MLEERSLFNLSELFSEFLLFDEHLFLFMTLSEHLELSIDSALPRLLAQHLRQFSKFLISYSLCHFIIASFLNRFHISFHLSQYLFIREAQDPSNHRPTAYIEFLASQALCECHVPWRASSFLDFSCTNRRVGVSTGFKRRRGFRRSQAARRPSMACYLLLNRDS